MQRIIAFSSSSSSSSCSACWLPFFAGFAFPFFGFCSAASASWFLVVTPLVARPLRRVASA